MRLFPAAALAVVVLGATATDVQPSTVVFGNGLAATCSRLAIAGLYDKQSLSTCTLAIEEEALRREDAAKTYVNRGVIHLRRASLDNAAKDFARAERLAPTIGEIYVNRGVVLIKQRKWAEAIAQIDKGIALDPIDPEKAYFNRALAREQINDIRGAYFDFRKASELAPEWDKPKVELARYTVERPS